MMNYDQQLNELMPLPSGEKTKSAAKFEPIIRTADEICGMQFPAIRYVVPGYIADGLTLLAGAPKLGKSWLCLDIAWAVATGGRCLGNIQCEAGDVLYLALEDNDRRLKDRMRKLGGHDEAPARLHFSTAWPRANEGGINLIRKWIGEHPNARLVIIDVLYMFRQLSKGREVPYEADYLAIKELQQLASDMGIAVVVVHHTRKGASDFDPFEAISGTLGLSGGADTGLVLTRGASGTTLYGRGRDIREIEVAVEFDAAACRWTALGDVSEVRRTDERSAILDALRDGGEPMSPTAVAEALGLKPNNVKQLLFKMSRKGEVVRTSRGLYRAVDHDSYSDDIVGPDIFDNHDN